MDNEKMKEIDTALDECIKKLRNATKGWEIRTFVTEYEELMFKKSDEVVKTILKAEKEPVEIKRQKDNWQNMREMGIDVENEGVVYDIVDLLIKSKLSYLEANEALCEADRALRHKALSTVLDRRDKPNYIPLEKSLNQNY